MNKLKILHVIDSLCIGGAERMLVGLANAMQEAGMDVSVCVTRNGLDLAPDLLTSIPVVVLDRKNRFDVKGLWSFIQIVKQQEIEIIHAHGRSSALFCSTAKILGLGNLPVILHDHLGGIMLDKRVSFTFKKIVIPIIDHYVGVSNDLADWAVAAGLQKSKISVVPNGMDITKIQTQPTVDIRKLYGVSVNRKIWVVVGNLRIEKGIDLLIEALNSAQLKNPPLVIVIGDFRNEEYVNYCSSLKTRYALNDVILFVGPQIDAIGWMKGADIGIMPSRSESGPLVLIEMAAVGLPFIGFRSGNIADQMARFFPDNFVESENIEGLVDLLKKAHSGYFESQYDSIINFNLDKFDIRTSVEKWLEIYQEVLVQK